MSLATRCTSCGTIFRVVQDQLKVSEGWVRCGRCQQVFNALEGLFDLDRDPPPQRRPEVASAADATHSALPAPPRSTPPRGDSDPAPAATAQASSALASPAVAPSDDSPPAPAHTEAPAWSDDVPATREDDALDSRWLVRPARDGRSARERHARHDPDSDFTDARFPNDAVADEWAEEPEPLAPELSAPLPMPPIPQARARRIRLGRAGTSQPADDTPAFVKRAKRQAQWRHPVVRATLSVTALALLALLGLQSAVAFRDWIVAYQPAARPHLARLCELAGCRLAPLERIDALAVDSVTLVRGASAAGNGNGGSGEPGYRLVVTVHNAAPVALAAPHLELSLTDADGQMVSRRVLSPADVGWHLPTVPPQQSTAFEAAVRTSGPRIAGYTVELFYP